MTTVGVAGINVQRLCGPGVCELADMLVLRLTLSALFPRCCYRGYFCSSLAILVLGQALHYGSGCIFSWGNTMFKRSSLSLEPLSLNCLKVAVLILSEKFKFELHLLFCDKSYSKQLKIQSNEISMKFTTHCTKPLPQRIFSVDWLLYW